MASKQVVQIIIEAEENVSKAANKAESSLSKLGKIGSKAMDAITNVSSRVSNAFSNLGSYVERAREKFNSFKNSSDKLGMLKSTISNAANSFGQLVRSGDLAAKTMERLKSVSDGISTKFTNLQSKIRSFGSSAKSSLKSAFSLTGIKEKLSNIGSSIDRLKAKLKELSAQSKATGGGFGFLKNAASMAAGMIGYDLVNSIMETTRASINARSSMQAFAGRLKMSSTEVTEYQKSLDTLQNSFKKIDMDVVGQQATDMAYRLGLPKTSLTELTETTAIFTDAMQRNGRSAEDSMLAMSDAMDGQFVRLKEIGIGQDDLMRNGWDGDINNKTALLDAMNKSLKEQHYDDLAKSVDTLDDAWQVLSITMGNLLESVLVPLTPVIVGMINGIMEFFNLIKSNPLAQAVVVIGGLTLGFALLAGSLVTAEGAFIGFEALMPGFITSLYGAASGFMAISVAGAPLWAIVAVVAAIALAVFEVGKAFGWWSDVGTMLEAIGAGLQRMWDAFINHPDVQAALTLISEAFTILWEAVQQACQAVLDFFGINTSGSFDIVWALITRIGQAWNQLKGFLAPVIISVMNIINAFNQFRTGQMDLPAFIITVLSQLGQAYNSMFMKIIGYLARFAAQMIQKGISAAVSFVNGIVNRIKQLPGKAYSALIAVVSKIVSAGQQWVSNAKSKASSVVSGVYNTLTGLPGKIASALSGVVNAFAKPFQEAYEKVKAKVDQIKEMASNIPVIGGMFGGDDYVPEGAMAGVDLSQNSNVTNAAEHNLTGELTLIHDLRNLPSGVTADDVARLIDETVSSEEFAKNLARNTSFQEYDLSVKQKLIAKTNRARGI